MKRSQGDPHGRGHADRRGAPDREIIDRIDHLMVVSTGDIPLRKREGPLIDHDDGIVLPIDCPDRMIGPCNHGYAGFLSKDAGRVIETSAVLINYHISFVTVNLQLFLIQAYILTEQVNQGRARTPLSPWECCSPVDCEDIINKPE
jgi:hypothetical protein